MYRSYCDVGCILRHTWGTRWNSHWLAPTAQMKHMPDCQNSTDHGVRSYRALEREHFVNRENVFVWGKVLGPNTRLIEEQQCSTRLPQLAFFPKGDHLRGLPSHEQGMIPLNQNAAARFAPPTATTSGRKIRHGPFRFCTKLVTLTDTGRPALAPRNSARSRRHEIVVF